MGYDAKQEDKEVEPTPDDDNFIDDRGVDRYSDDELGFAPASPSHAPEVCNSAPRMDVIVADCAQAGSLTNLFCCRDGVPCL